MDTITLTHYFNLNLPDKSWHSTLSFRRALVPDDTSRNSTTIASLDSSKRLQVQQQFLRGRITATKKRIQATGKSMEMASPKTVTVQVAHELLKAGHRYLDVRTPEEFNAGHVEDAINVPYMFKAGEGMTKNSTFIQDVLSHFSKDDQIVVGCQSGRRSLMAAKDLMCSEFTGITDVGGGYSAWVQSGLPVKCNT